MPYTESEWPNTHAGKSVYNHAEPRTVVVLLAYYFVETSHCLFDAYGIVDYFFVYLMSIAKLPKIDALCRADYFDFGRMCGLVVKGDYHTARDVQELTVDFQDSR